MQKSVEKETSSIKSIPDKLFYKIGEVSRIAEVEPYVLRYWESEFQFLKPRKSKSGQRIYVKKDLELILQIKQMLYGERFTIEGVRKRLGDSSTQRRPIEPETPAVSGNAIDHVKKRLKEILQSIK